MKNLKDIVNEAIALELKQKLVDIINSDLLTDKTAKKMISIANEISPEMKKIIDDMMIHKGIEDVSKTIIRILNDYDEYELLSKLTTDNSISFTSNEFINNTNIYNLIISKYPTIEKDCLKELSALNNSKHSITRGMFEIIVQLFLSDIADKNDSKNSPIGHGDVNTLYHTIEFKTPEARVKSQKERTAKDIDNYIESYLKKINIKIKDLELKNSKGGLFRSQMSINELFAALSKYNLSDDELFDLIAKALFAMYDKNVIKKNYKLPFNENSIKSQIVSNGKVNAKNVIRLMGCVQLKYYAEEENFTHFCVFRGRKKDNAINTGEYKCFENSYVSDIESVFFDKTINFFAGGKHDNSARENYCCITYV